MSILIKNGEIVNADKSFKSDVLIEGELISKIGENLSSDRVDEVVDASGKYIFPGFIDPHVHIYLPFMGTYAKDTWETAGKAAVVGGTTTLIEMVCPSRAEDPIEAFNLWNGKAQGLSPIDYTFHMGVTKYDEKTEEEMIKIVKDFGITSFKVFLAYKGAFGVTDEELFKVLTLAKKLGVVVTAHCENADLISSLQEKLVSEGKVGPEWHEPSRPVQVEAEGCHHLMTFAELTNASVYVVHTSCEESVLEISKAVKRGVDAKIETVVPYLVLDKSYAEKEDFEGAKYVMSPPIRDSYQQEKLWKYLADGTIATVGTDHAPFDFYSQKHMGHYDESSCLDAEGNSANNAGNFTMIPNGLPSVEDRINLLYTYGVKRGKISLNKLVECGSTNAAKIFGLHPRKGEIKVGADADVVVYDPNYEGKISAETHLMATDYSAFEGVKIEGRPDLVSVRGKVMSRSGKFVGNLGHGKLLKRKSTG